MPAETTGRVWGPIREVCGCSPPDDEDVDNCPGIAYSRTAYVRCPEGCDEGWLPVYYHDPPSASDPGQPCATCNPEEGPRPEMPGWVPEVYAADEGTCSYVTERITRDEFWDIVYARLQDLDFDGYGRWICDRLPLALAVAEHLMGGEG